MKPSPPAVSVVICSHNPRQEYLTRALAALWRQTLPLDQWELLLVDNCSAEPLAGRFDLTWHPSGRHVREEDLGLTPARLCGIKESAGDLLVFVDDDNLLEADYLENAATLGKSYPFLGVFGGNIEPEYEVEPKKHVRPHLGGLAIRKVERIMWSNLANHFVATPCGAGMVIRRFVALEYRRLALEDPKRRYLDRQGLQTKVISSGGDSDMAFTACDLDLGMGLFPQLRMVHIIPPGRLRIDYLIRLYESFGQSEVLLRYFREPLRRPNYLARVAEYLRAFINRPLSRKLQHAYLRGRNRTYAELLDHPAPKLK